MDEAKAQGVGQKEVTPFLLRRIVELTDGRSLEANMALVKNNAVARRAGGGRTRRVCEAVARAARVLVIGDVMIDLAGAPGGTARDRLGPARVDRRAARRLGRQPGGLARPFWRRRRFRRPRRRQATTRRKAAMFGRAASSRGWPPTGSARPAA